MVSSSIPQDLIFQSTLSLRRATHAIRYALLASTISIHALLAESDGYRSDRYPGKWEISIHALLAESDLERSAPPYQSIDFNPRSPCGERRHSQRNIHRPHCISIHALLAESDEPSFTPSGAQHIFQSTLSLRRATQSARPRPLLHGFQSTLSLRRATAGTVLKG